MAKFRRGNSGGAGGNAMAAAASKLRAALLRCITEEDFEELGRELVKAAKKQMKSGDVRAFDALADRAIGKPAQTVEHEAGESIVELLEALAAAREEK